MTFLKYSDSCPKCGRPDLYEGDGQTCRGCRREFRAGDAVYFDNVPGELLEINWDDAERHMYGGTCECDCGCIFCEDEDQVDDDDIEEMIETKLWFVAYKDKFERVPPRSKKLVEAKEPSPNLVHAAWWAPPPVGPGHPVYEETMDVIRKINAARKSRSFHLSQLAKIDREMEVAWGKVQPALNKLLEAKEEECRSTTSDASTTQGTTSGSQGTHEMIVDPTT